jgi:hypothetical protein
MPAGGKSVPTLVKVISVLYYIGAAFSVLFAVLLFVGAGSIGALLSEVPLLGSIGAGFFIVLGIIFIALAVLDFFIARGLWKGKNWARIVAVIFAVLGVLMAIFGMVGGAIGSNLFSLIINGLIGYYLLFTKQVKEAFA